MTGSRRSTTHLVKLKRPQFILFGAAILFLTTLGWCVHSGKITIDTFNFIASFTALAGFLFTLYQFQIQIHDAKQQSENLLQIQHSLSTRYIGSFPAFVSGIAQTISSAQQEVIIFCDFPAYGCMSDPIGWLSYRHAIEKKLCEKVSVELICMSKEARVKHSNSHYSGTAWTTKKEEPHFRERLQKFLHAAAATESAADITNTRLVELLEQHDSEALSHSFRGAEVREIDEYIPLLFWISDRRQAIFAFPGYTDQSVEHGFTTNDQRLLTALLEIKERYKPLKTTNA